MIAEAAPSPFCLGGFCLTWVAVLWVAALVVTVAGVFVFAAVQNARPPLPCTCGHDFASHATEPSRCLAPSGCACIAYKST